MVRSCSARHEPASGAAKSLLRQRLWLALYPPPDPFLPAECLNRYYGSGFMAMPLQLIRSPFCIGMFCLVGAGLVSADPPQGYYDSVDASTPESLRSTLHEVIDDHVRFPYTATTTDTWNILELADEDPNDPDRILDVYKNASYQKFGAGNNFYQMVTEGLVTLEKVQVIKYRGESKPA